MPNKRHPFRGTVCPHCGNDLHCKIGVVLEGLKLTELIPQERKDFWPEDPPALPEDVTQWIDSIGDDTFLTAVDYAIGKKKLETHGNAIAAGISETMDHVNLSSRYPCPACHKSLQLVLHLRVLGAVKFEKADVGDSWQTKGFSAGEIEVIRECRHNGVLKAFTDAINFEFGESRDKPKNMDRFFMQFLNTAQLDRLPAVMRNELAGKFPNMMLRLWRASRIGAITIDNAIYQFVPQSVLLEASTREVSARRTLARQVGLHTKDRARWIKTRHGYVPPGNKVFLEALRQKSVGDFNKPSL